ncbi:GSCFA domain-containing protein [Xinfangfangia sp. D13-10-4-6]|uniref:GSCFA domain-containing protein n=1 Tax=Pseudogemmobacter hezensis TaxID=2737662 RepID=UPI00155417A8|nr:GSCFA domain-containing protein [Pseudogemmobacter hezensis]NPD15183.1 GSCFA domain-containing protein [Pseudogemmobacter hezensis]
MSNPYSSLPAKKFWRSAVADRHMFDVSELWDPKFQIRPEDKVATYGSCFAQHIGRALKANGYQWHITEKPPVGLSDPEKFGYNVFSSRTANIYTTSLLLQWVKWAIEAESPPAEVWNDKGRSVDPFRPKIEPAGFVSDEEMRLSRKQVIKSFRDSITGSDVFVFTLGLTESWVNSGLGYEYPMCPGTAGGTFDAKNHQFVNHDYEMALSNLSQAIDLMRSVNGNLKFLVTVSPVPLTATYTDNNVIVATMESKSILRAVAAKISKMHDFVDYFPSYEIINSPVFKGVFFDPNQRNVNHAGVDFVMKNFFACLNGKFGGSGAAEIKSAAQAQADSKALVCEEELLNAFGKEKNK